MESYANLKRFRKKPNLVVDNIVQKVKIEFESPKFQWVMIQYIKSVTIHKRDELNLFLKYKTISIF